MKRLHVHVSVDDLGQSIQFYTALFAVPPTVEKPDYAKWMLDDPRVNFAISKRGTPAGLDHFGIQVENQEELHEVYDRLKKADRPVLEQGATTCCYAQSEKSWVADPQGLSWETFLTTGDSADLGAIRPLKRRAARPKHRKARAAPLNPNCRPVRPAAADRRSYHVEPRL